MNEIEVVGRTIGGAFVAMTKPNMTGQYTRS